MPTTLRFEGLPPNPNQQRGKHWAQLYKEQQEWKRMSWFLAKASKGPLLQRAHLHYTISVGDNRTHDGDNLISSMKNCQDGLKGVLIVDDSIDHITVSYEFNRQKPRGFTIRIEPLELPQEQSQAVIATAS